jgi:hypothetical protein
MCSVAAGDGPSVGAPLTADPRIAGVCFTGSTEVAKLIEKQLAKTAAPDAMLIAETGRLNAMIVDSTALPEQAVRDILASSFQSAGQRCSALRILYVQKDVEKKVLEMLEGAMNALTSAIHGNWPPMSARSSMRTPRNRSRPTVPILRKPASSSQNSMRQRTAVSWLRMSFASKASRKWTARFSDQCCMSQHSRLTTSTG